jgi:hypothetical protein
MMVLIIFSFSLLRYLPGMQITTDIWVVIMALILIVFIFNKLLNPRIKFTSVELYSLVILTVMPAMGAFTAYFEFGQPIVYGMLSQRSSLLIGFVFLISYLLKSGYVRIQEVSVAFTALAWINLAVCAPVIFILNPNDYSDLPNLVSDGGGVYNQFILPMTFILFGFFYYAVAGLRRKSKWLTLLSLPFLIYLVVGVSGRTLMLSILVTYILFSILLLKPAKIISGLINFLSFTIVFLLVVQIVDPDKITEITSKYSDAFLAVIRGEEGGDPSANARIIQAAIALPLILQNPIFGTGTISNQWNDGYKSLFGYFHPSDLGLLGVIFVYGIVGAIVYAYQFLLTWRLTRNLKPAELLVHDLYFAISAYLVYFNLSSVATGAYVFWFEHAMIFMAILNYGYLNKYKINN